MVDLSDSNLEHVVFLKLGAYSTNDLITNTIPLKVTSVELGTSKTIPSMEVPFSGALSGESMTAALDLGMASKTVGLSGFILGDSITRKWAEDDTSIVLNFTAIEIAQMIHSSVDSTGIQIYQAVNELVFLYDSKVNNLGEQRTSPVAIPFTWASRGARKEKDNRGAILSKDFPTDRYSDGIKGFIRSFTTTIDSETIDIGFTLQFEVATVFPSGNVATTISDAIS